MTDPDSHKGVNSVICPTAGCINVYWSCMYGKRMAQSYVRLLESESFATMEVMDVNFPFEFLDPTTGRACMLLVSESPSVPKYFRHPTILRSPSWRLAFNSCSMERFTRVAVGKKPLASRFNRDGTHHVSSLVCLNERRPRPTQRDPVHRAMSGISMTVDCVTRSQEKWEAEDNHPSKFAKNDEGTRIPWSIITVPQRVWTVDR